MGYLYQENSAPAFAMFKFIQVSIEFIKHVKIIFGIGLSEGEETMVCKDLKFAQTQPYDPRSLMA